MIDAEKNRRNDRPIKLLVWLQLVLGVVVIIFCYVERNKTVHGPDSPANVTVVTKAMYEGLFKLYDIAFFNALPGLAGMQVIWALLILSYLQRRKVKERDA